MLIRKCHVDAASDFESPIPTVVVSNGEFIPPPQSARQQTFEARLRDVARYNARLLGMTRRQFLRTSCGLATAMLCFNEVFGHTYDVLPVEAFEPPAFKEHWPKKEFIFDNQTHHVDLSSRWFEKTPAGPFLISLLLRFRTDMVEAVRGTPPTQTGSPESLQVLNKTNYIKELFFDSDTVMGVISGVPAATWEEAILPPDQMVQTRNDINTWAGSQRMLSHGIVRPDLGPRELDEMERQVKVLKVDSWKMYPGADIGYGLWWLDDEKVAYPFWERTAKLGVKNVCVHKGLPLGLFNEDHCHPRDVEKAAKDFPQLNFIIYHSGFHPMARREGPRANDPQYIPWVSELIEIVGRNNLPNVYFELGTTWNVMSSAWPEAAMHFFGQVLNLPSGEDRIIWGTDSILNGGPQSQIERFRRFQIRDDIAQQYGYRKLTPAIKAKVLGLNAARLYGIDVKAKRHAIAADRVAQAQDAYQENPRPSNTQFGWVRRSR